jgi:2-methylcitrate dehydratase PrpD
MDPIEAFASHVTRLRPEDLPPGTVAAAKRLIADTLAVGAAGSAAPWADVLAAQAAGWGRGRGHEATVWGTRARLPAPAAALVNAYQVHALEFDAFHEGAVVHPMTALLPAVLAHAERVGGVSGADLLVAVAAGVDVAVGLGLAATQPMRFFRPATAGGFGAVAALGRLAGLDASALIDAFGIFYGQVAGTMQPHHEGSPVTALQMGAAARAAVTAVDLARAGMPGPREVLAGPYGYLRLFEGDQHDVEPVLWDLGRRWHVIGTSQKPFPCGRYTHGTLDALRHLRAEHGFLPTDVARLLVRLPPLAARLVGRPWRTDPAPGYARLCLPYVAAVMLLRGEVTLGDFTPERLREAEVDDLARRVEVTVDAGASPQGIVPQTIRVELRDGRAHERRVDCVLGHPDNPLSDGAHRFKVVTAMKTALTPLGTTQSGRVLGLTERLEGVADAGLLARILTRAHRPARRRP